MSAQKQTGCQPRRAVWGKRLAVSLVTAVALLVAGYFWASSYSIYRPRSLDQARLTQAVRWVQANQPSQNGEVTLPPGLAGVSVNGKAYVTDGVIFFPSWMGRRTLLPSYPGEDDGWIEGYSFSAQPLPTMADSPAGSDRFFLMMDFSGPAHVPSAEGSGRQMAIDERLRGPWYRADSFS